MTKELLYVLVGAVIGICGGFVAQYVQTKIWLNKDIEKTKSLLLSELNDMYTTLKFEKRQFALSLENSQNEFKSVCKLQLPADEILTTTFDLMRLRFLTWELLISSGALFKLEKNDILVLQTIQHNVCKHDSDLNDIRKKFESEFTEQIRLLGYERLLSEKHDLLAPCFKKYCNVIGGTLMTLKEELDKLDWFDYRKIPEKKLNISRYGNIF